MELNITWYQPIPLLDGEKQDLIYTAKNLEEWDGVPGVYMFCRVFDGEIFPLYIGKAENIAGRLRQHFKTSINLMKRIKKAAKGAKVVIPGEFTPKPGQSTKKCLTIIERALINHALTEGNELLNVQGTKTPTNRIKFSGFLGARNITGQTLNAEAKG